MWSQYNSIHIMCMQKDNHRSAWLKDYGSDYDINNSFYLCKPIAKWPKDLKRTNIKAFVAENETSI